MSQKIADLVSDYKKGTIEDIDDFRDKLRAEVYKHDTTMTIGRDVPRELSPKETVKAVETAYKMQLAYGVANGQEWAIDKLREKNLAIGVGSTGGFTTNPEFHDELTDLTEGASVLMPKCQRFNMKTNEMYIPGSDTRPSVTLASENDAITITEPTYERKTLSTFRVNTYVKGSKEFFEDSELDMLGILLSQFTEAAGQEMDNVICNSDGGSAAFSGIFTATVGYSEVFGTGSTAFSEVLASNLVDLIHKIPHYVRSSGALVMHPDVYKYLALETDSNGNFRLPPYGTGAVPSVHGYSLLQTHQAPSESDSGAGKAFIAFGNFRYLALGVRNQSQFIIDPYSNSLNNQTNLIWVARYALSYLKTEAFARLMTAAE